MSNAVVDVGDQDFESAVIERSRSVPVVVDFWAPWCGPCRALGPLLERLADEFGGQFVLAKVNVDESPAVAQAFRVQSIPMVLGFRDGQPVAQFVGALPESGVREFLQRVLPNEAEVSAREGSELRAQGDLVAAEQKLQHALALDSRCEPALLEMAAIHAERGETAAAMALLERIAPGPSRSAADRLAAQLRIREAGAGDEASLRARLDANPADLDARFELAQVLAAAGRYDDALPQYLEIVRRDRRFRDDGARKAMLDVFDLLGSGHELVDRFRSELAKVLFS